MTDPDRPNHAYLLMAYDRLYRAASRLCAAPWPDVGGELYDNLDRVRDVVRAVGMFRDDIGPPVDSVGEVITGENARLLAGTLSHDPTADAVPYDGEPERLPVDTVILVENGSPTHEPISVRCKSQIFTSANVLEVAAGTTCPRGGDSGHGGRTVLEFRDLGSTDLDAFVDFDEYGARRVRIVLGGDTECETFIDALKFAHDTLHAQWKG